MPTLKARLDAAVASRVTLDKLQEVLDAAAADGKITDAEAKTLATAVQENPSAFTDAAKVDIDAVLEVAKALGAEMGAAAARSGDASRFRDTLKERFPSYDLMASMHTMRDSHVNAPVPMGLSLSGSGGIEAKGPHGTAYLVGGGTKIENLQVNVRPIKHKKDGKGYELRLKVSKKTGNAIERELAKLDETRLISKKITDTKNMKDGTVVIDAVEAEPPSPNSYGYGGDGMNLGPCLRYEVAKRFRIDYFPEELAKQALRGGVHVEAYGKTEAEKKKNAAEAFELLGLKEELEKEPSSTEQKKHQAMRLLWQAAPREAAKLAAKASFSLTTVKAALKKAKVPTEFLQNARYAEVAPGQITVVTPTQGEAYRRAGIRAITHEVSNSDRVADILAAGALLSTGARLAERLVVTGMSSSEDLDTGGAEYVFTRLVTEKMGNLSMSYSGAILSIEPDILDRTDWFAYAEDNYGSTFMDEDLGDVSPAVKTIAERNFNADDHRYVDDIDDYLGELRDEVNNGSGSGEFWDRETGRKLVDRLDNGDSYYGGPSEIGDLSNEAMFRGSVPVSFIKEVIVTRDEERKKILKQLKAKGVKMIGDRKVEDVVVVRKKIFPEATAPDREVDDANYI
jgi:hypothetical protein